LQVTCNATCLNIWMFSKAYNSVIQNTIIHLSAAGASLSSDNFSVPCNDAARISSHSVTSNGKKIFETQNGKLREKKKSYHNSGYIVYVMYILHILYFLQERRNSWQTAVKIISVFSGSTKVEILKE
jgi:hypothetical protein